MNPKTKNIIALIVAVAAILGFVWFALNFGVGGEKVESEKPLVICNPPNIPPEQQKCFWTAHIHFHLKVFDKQGNVITVGFEQGDLQAMHTHAEAGLIHWHGLIPVDPRGKQVKDWSALEVQNIPRDLKLSLEGTPKFIANGKEVEPSYIWQDGDHIEIHYE